MDRVQTDVGIAQVSSQFPRRCAEGEYKACYITAQQADRAVGLSRYSLEICKRGCLSPDESESAENFRACASYLRQMVAYFKRAGIQSDLLDAGKQAALRCNYPIDYSRGSNATERISHCEAALVTFGAGVDHRYKSQQNDPIYEQIAVPRGCQ
jgi:hypothetical protein